MIVITRQRPRTVRPSGSMVMTGDMAKCGMYCPGREPDAALAERVDVEAPQLLAARHGLGAVGRGAVLGEEVRQIVPERELQVLGVGVLHATDIAQGLGTAHAGLEPIDAGGRQRALSRGGGHGKTHGREGISRAPL